MDMSEAVRAQIVLRYIAVGMQIIAARLLVVIGLLMAFAIALWCLYDPDKYRLIVLGLFSVMVYWPLCMADAKTKSQRAEIAPGGSDG